MSRRMLALAVAGLTLAGLAPGAAHAQVVLGHTIGTSFTGNSLSDPTQPGLAPPDTNGAVGINHYVQFTNGGYAVYDKSTGALATARVSDATFWANAGISGAVLNPGLSDTRIIFDARSQRWFAAEINVSFPDNQVLLAVSQDANPLNGFKAVSYAGPPSGEFADYPVLSVNADGVTISTNNFDATGTLFTGVSVTTIPKSDLLWSGAGSPSVANRTIFDDPTASLGFTVQGVTSVDPSIGHTSLVAVSATSYGALNRTDISNVTGPGAATLGATTNVTVQATSDPGQSRQPDGTRQIDGLDERIGGTASAYMVGGNIFLVHGISVDASGVAATVSAATHNALRVVVLNEATNAVVTESTLFSNTYDYIMPSIAVNPFGDIVVGFTRSGGAGSTDGFLSSYADVGKFNGTSIAWDTPFLAGTGSGPTGGGLGQANYHLFGGSFERWGDYSTTNVDPTDPYSFWTVQEFAGTGDVWRTQVTQINLINLASVPEPGPIALAGLAGLAATAASWRRRRLRAQA